jgi:sterol desaturase/sphingolipid hydroxylase (fatty acid hydroxylase superfamily)
MSVSNQVFDRLATTYSVEGLSITIGLFLYAWLHVAERLFPAERNQSYRSMIVTNGRIALVYWLLSPVASVGAQFLTGYAVARLASQLDAPWLFIDLNKVASIHSDLIRYPMLLLIVFLPWVAYDFFYYWFHRLQHASAWLWEQHKLHHSDEALNVTTTFRHNWLEDFFKFPFVTVPIALILHIHYSPVQVGLATSFAGAMFMVWGVFLHSNVGISWGILTPVITGPQYHRIHHSVETRHQNKNFSSFLPIWDILFGTYYHASDKEYPQTGIAGEPSDPTMREVLVGPILRWGAKLFKFAYTAEKESD